MRANSSSVLTAKSCGASPRVGTEHEHGEYPDHQQVAAGDGGQRTEEVLRQRRSSLTRDARHQHAGRQASVEQDGQTDVAGGLAPLAQDLHRDGTDHADRHRPRHRSLTGQQRQTDSGDRHVTETVAEQAESSLDDVDADRRGDDPRQQRGEQGPLHERIAQDLDHRSYGHRPASRPGRSGSTCSWPVCGWPPRCALARRSPPGFPGRRPGPRAGSPRGRGAGSAGRSRAAPPRRRGRR